MSEIKNYKETTIAHFSGLFDIYGNDVRSVDWGSETSQELRFDVLMKIVSKNAFSALDIGCGKGDFFNFLEKQGFDVNFTGVDLNRKVIDLANSVINAEKAKFLEMDVLQSSDVPIVDYVFASGIFYLRIDDNLGYFNKMLDKMLAVAQEGIAFNMLNHYSDHHETHEYYFKPEWVTEQLAQRNLRFVLRNDYKPNDFSVYVYR